MATSKVVKLEDVNSLQDGDEGRLDREESLLNTDLNGLQRLKTQSEGSLRSSLKSSKQNGLLPPATAESLQGEAADILFPLPEGWPRLPEIFAKREYTKAMSTSVNKASSHLELLQNIIDEWFDLQVASRSSTRASMLASMKGGDSSAFDRKQLRFTSQSRSTATTLRVEGVGGKADRDVQSAERAASELDIPYLGAEEVLDEVMTLLGKLETDRIESMTQYKQQIHLVRNLGARIDGIAEHRMNELPKAVQKEHEACSRDIYELQWHVSYRGRAEDRITNKMEIADALNKKLKDDIAFVSRHCPLVEEKLELEQEAMERIQIAQTETTEELNLTLERCARVEKKSADAHAKAESERNKMKKEIESITKELNRISQELADAHSLHESYIHRIYSTREQLQNCEQEITVLEVKNENSKTQEAMQAAKVQDLQAKIEVQEQEHMRLMEENLQRQSDIVIQKKSFQHREEEFQKEIYTLEDEHQLVSHVAAENEMDIEDMRRKIEDCARQKIADEKNVIRIKKEMEKTDEQMKVTLDEFIKVEAVNNAIREKLRSEEEKALAIEDSLKQTAEALKKQVKDEIHARTVLQARIGSDGQELIKSKADSKGKKEKVKKVAAEIEEAVKTVLGKVEKLRDIHAEKSAIVNGLQDNISGLKGKHQEAEGSLNGRLSDLKPHAQHLKEDILSYEKKIDHIEWRAEMMQKKMDDMGASAGMMTRLTHTTERQIRHLTEELEEVTTQFEAGQKLEDELRISLNALTARNRDYENKHKSYLEVRHQVACQHDLDLETNKTLNQELASKYRRLQNQYIILKDKLLNHYEERIQLENDVKDLKQLESLQQKMHFALAEYYKYRGAYNKGELARLETVSYENGAKLVSLQTEMDTALDGITKFLTQQMDPTVARQIAIEKLSREHVSQHC
ncbi:coiled-coil domain-containing protein 178-like [Lineus longissimus]|uniref:coiled-coil domain-containing protein 178-like n=1 Tax=Lineus longissimus TaxID=88925 RepID=UPI002B4CC3B3